MFFSLLDFRWLWWDMANWMQALSHHSSCFISKCGALLPLGYPHANAPWLIKSVLCGPPSFFPNTFLSLFPQADPSHSQSFWLPFTSELFLVLKIFKLSTRDRSHSYFSSTPLYKIKTYQTWGWKKGHELFSLQVEGCCHFPDFSFKFPLKKKKKKSDILHESFLELTVFF